MDMPAGRQSMDRIKEDVMRRNTSSVFMMVLLLGIASMSITTLPAEAKDRCENFAGTIIGHFAIDDQGEAWVGRAYISINDGPVVNAALRDEYDPASAHPTMATPSGNWSGNEVLTFAVEGVGTFKVRGHYTASAASSPFLWGFHETVKVDPSEATGAFAGMTGSMSIQGTFAVGGGGVYPPSDTNPWSWLAQITGSVCDAPSF
jgi:hypothetical protein